MFKIIGAALAVEEGLLLLTETVDMLVARGKFHAYAVIIAGDVAVAGNSVRLFNCRKDRFAVSLKFYLEARPVFCKNNRQAAVFKDAAVFFKLHLSLTVLRGKKRPPFIGYAGVS